MEDSLQKLIAISRAFSLDTSLVVGTGGNTSVKTDDGKHMYIKASGTALKDMSETNGWRRLKNNLVLAIFNDNKLAGLSATEREFEIVNLLQSACDDNMSNARPSVESILHVLLDKYVIHLHALVVLAYACAKNGKAELHKLFKDEQAPPLWVSYAGPGFSLSCEVFRQVECYREKYGKKPNVMILEKHGLLVSDETSDGVLSLVRKTINRCREGLVEQKYIDSKKIIFEDIHSAKHTIQKVFTETTVQQSQVTHYYDPTIAAFSAREDAEDLLQISALTPDEMGFVSSPVIWLENCNYEKVLRKINEGFSKGQKFPVAFLVKDVGLFVIGNSKFASIISEVIIGSLFVRSNAMDIGGINPLTIREREFIQNWEGEKFRVKVAKGS